MTAPGMTAPGMAGPGMTGPGMMEPTMTEGEPYVVNLLQTVLRNENFRNTLWTGKHLQLTTMTIPTGSDIGLEQHTNVDQFLYIESGHGYVTIGDTKDNLDFRFRVFPGYAIFVPAGTWHNLINAGQFSLKLFSIYAPPEHPAGTIHRTKMDAMEAEKTMG